MEGHDRPPARLVEALATRIRGVLGDDLVGLYLYGSSVSGGFDPGVSDLDLVAVTSTEVEALDLPALERMHRRFVGRYPEWRDRVEIVYIGRVTLESFRTSAGSLAVISPGEPFHVRTERAVEWLQNWYLVRETGLTLYGAKATAIIPPIAWSEFVAANVRYADEVRNRGRVGASGGTVAYAVLTMCRALRTVRTQRHASKQEAAAWARARMPEWAWLIDAALDCRLSRGTVGLDDEPTRAAAEEFSASSPTRSRRMRRRSTPVASAWTPIPAGPALPTVLGALECRGRLTHSTGVPILHRCIERSPPDSAVERQDRSRQTSTSRPGHSSGRRGANSGPGAPGDTAHGPEKEHRTHAHTVRLVHDGHLRAPERPPAVATARPRRLQGSLLRDQWLRDDPPGRHCSERRHLPDLRLPTPSRLTARPLGLLRASPTGQRP